jgi:hypothetical protein
MLALSMNGTHKTRSRWADKIAFLSLFIAVLLIARFIVTQRSAIVLSEPIVLNCADLSVRIPMGNGWQGEKRWRYQQNAFSLDGFFTPGTGNVTTIFSCKYQLAAAKDTPAALFEKKASAINSAEIAGTGQINITKSAEGQQNKGVTTIDWAYIKGSKILFDMFFGVAQLANGRRLDIEVYQSTGDTDMAEGIFKSITESLKFTDNQLLEAGSRIVAEIKSKGLDSFLTSAGNKQGQDRETFFLIKDATGKSIGFTMEVLHPLEQERFGAMSYYYIIHGQHYHEQATLFQSVNNLKEFSWESKTIGPGGRSSTESVLDKDGIMTVKDFDLPAEEKIYQPGPAAIPDVTGEFILGQMLDSNETEIMVDIIEDDGKISPAIVSKTDVAKEEAAYVFRMELLDGRGFSEQLYLDDQGQISKILLRRENTHTLERTGAEDILREFPEKGGYILRKKDEIMKNSLLWENIEQ